MPDDLKHWTAPTFWRLHRDKVWASIFLVCLVVARFTPNNAELAKGAAVGYSTFPQPSEGAITSLASKGFASAPHDCLKLRKGKWLRWQIAHKGKDAEPWSNIECRYD